MRLAPAALTAAAFLFGGAAGHTLVETNESSAGAASILKQVCAGTTSPTQGTNRLAGLLVLQQASFQHDQNVLPPNVHEKQLHPAFGDGDALLYCQPADIRKDSNAM